jgi:hypothetical protein
VTQFSDTGLGSDEQKEQRARPMSEYFLADVRAQERAGQREREKNRNGKESPPKQAQDMKVTLLGDFLFPTSEPQGCDPYNATNGKSVREAWRMRRDRR